MPDNKKKQKNFYDQAFKAPHIWKDTDFPESSRYLHNRFLDIAIRKDARNILEIGCGNGLLTFFLLKRPISITAVDISGKAIENMRAQFKEEINQGKLKTACTDLIEFLEISQEKFDVIIGSGIIHHIEKEKWDKFFLLAHKRLAPGGIFACAPEPNASGLYKIAWRLAWFFYKFFGITYDSEVEKGTLDMLPRKIKLALESVNFSQVEILPFQVVPHFHWRFLAYLDRLILDKIRGKFALYIMVKAEKK